MKPSIYLTERLAKWNMLHIILGILKAVGIIVGILLLILILLLLSAVFVPVRYRVKAVKQEERAEIEAGFSWLLHLVSVHVFFGISKEAVFSVKICGIRLPFGRKEKKEKQEKQSFSERKEKTAAENFAAGDITGTFTEPVETAEEPERREPEETGEKEETKATEEGKEPEKTTEKERKDSPDTPPERTEKRKIRFLLGRLCDKIKQIIRKLKAIWRRLLRIPEDICAAGDRIRAVSDRFEQFLSFLDEYEVRECVYTVFGYLKELLRHIGPRRIRGYLYFGCEDPAVTGQLTGLVYLLLPARADRFEVRPDFHQTAFETEIICSGHIRACHFIAAGFRAFRNKKLCRLVRRIRNRK